jgi:mannitol-specific phosphotransferase system IIBC component
MLTVAIAILTAAAAALIVVAVLLAADRNTLNRIRAAERRGRQRRADNARARRKRALREAAAEYDRSKTKRDLDEIIRLASKRLEGGDQ